MKANVKIEITEGCGIITICRPDVLNALNTETIITLKNKFRDFRNNKDVGVVILTGEGERAFIAGADIKEMETLNPVEATEFAKRGQDLTRFIESFTKPVIAAVNGYALGGGCEVALSCHIRIASENAKFSQPEVNLGIIPGWGGTQRLSRVVGQGKAIEMITSGEMISAQEAQTYRLVNYVVPHEELMKKARDIANSILRRSPEAIKIALEAIQCGREMTLSEGLAYEANLFGIVFSTEDKHEGIQAFLEKRPPRFKKR